MERINKLLDGNKKWAAEIKESDPQFFEKLSEVQKPEFLWIGCADSRITPSSSIGMLPGEMFVHRNVANLVIHSDINCLSVMQFAVEVLGVPHIIVCGHYGCGGVRAALDNARYGPIDNWLRHIQDIARKHQTELDSLPDDAERRDRMCEINVVEQVTNVGLTTVVQDAWQRGQELWVHGWIYTIADGIYQDLNVTISSNQELDNLRSAAANAGELLAASR
jgi:carbonic anhydrase